MQFPVPHGRRRTPARPLGDPLGPEFLAAPGADDDVRRAADGLERVRDDAVPAERTGRKLGEETNIEYLTGDGATAGTLK